MIFKYLLRFFITNNKMKLLEQELNKYKNINKDIYDNFIIGDKEPKYTLKYHTNSIYCMIIKFMNRFFELNIKIIIYIIIIIIYRFIFI